MYQFAKGPPRENLDAIDDPKLMGCAPYLQIFKGGKLIFTTAATLHVQQPDEELPFVQVVDGTVPFNIEQVIQGDILIRCRHLTFHKQRVSMFRAAFHTGYVPPNVLRLTKSQLDGACADRRYPDDFFLDLIFEKVDMETATKHLEGHSETGEDADSPKKGKGPVVKASNIDAMLQGDSRFWDIIANRREEQSSRKKTDDPLWGPTVGRRRGDNTLKVKKGTSPKVQTQLDTFSIGNEFDFLPVEPTAVVPQKPVEKDMLMEALGALDEDDTETEEVVFEDASATVPANKLDIHLEESTSEQDSAPETATPEEATTDATPVASRTSSTLDEDMDALLAGTDEDLGDIILEDFDDDDDLGDLEAMLKS